MALRIWLPLNGSLENKGISNGTVATTVTDIWNDNGKIGKCALSNAKASYTFPELTNITNFSISYWIYIDSSIAIQNWADIWGINCIAGNSSTVIRDEFKSAVGIHQLLMGKDSAVGSNTNTYIGTGMSDSNAKDKWVHIALVKDNTTAKVYTNGVLTNTINSSTFESTPQKLTGYLIIGNTTSSAAKLNDFRIYDHSLSAREVKELSQGLILHYKLDGFSGGAGENLLINSSLKKRVNGFPNITTYAQTFEKKDGYDCYHIHSDTLGKTSYLSWDVKNIINNYPIGTKFVFSGWIKADDIAKGTTNYFASLYYGGSYNNNGTSTWIGEGSRIVSSPTSNSAFDLSGKGWTYCYIISTFTRNDYTSMGAMYYLRDFTGDVYFRDFKLEVGDRPTAWSPAPQDFGIDTSKIVDSSGYGNDGAITGNLTTGTDDGRYNISTYFSSGNTNYITTPTLTLPGDAITMNFWFKSSNKTPGADYHMPLAAAASSNQAYEMSIHKNGYLRGGLVVAGTRKVDNCTSTKLLDGNWHMCTMTYDGATIKRYVDAVMEKSTTATGALVTSAPFVLGHYGTNTSYYNKEAYESDVRIYATALSAEDIVDLYHTPANIDNLGGIHGFEFIEKTPNLLNPDPKEWTIETSVTCVWNEETGYFDVNTNRDTSVTSRWGVYTGVPIKPNTTYLFSAEVLDNKSYIGVAGGTSSRSLPSNIISWNGEKRYYYFFTTSSSHTHAWVYLCSKPSETTAGHFKNIYLGEVGEIASIKQSGIFENEDMVEYNENGRITKSGELAGSNFIEK